MDITERILQKLEEVERTEDVKIIYCAESGSRALGFASPDSDYDLRFVYLRRPEFYLRLGKTRDVIEWQLDDVFDISGWDVQKVLRLLRGSNSSLYEWNGSPIVYRTSPEWEKVSALFEECFLPSASFRHYLGMAKNNYHSCLRGETVKLKKYLYVLRTILAARWVAEKGTNPPVPLSELVSAELEPSLRGAVDELVRIKSGTSEPGSSAHIPEIDEYITKSLDELSALEDGFKQSDKADWEPLDRVFLELLKTRVN